MKTRRQIWKHMAWGVTFDGVYDSSLKLSYSEEDAWWIAALKCNQISKTGKVAPYTKAKLKKRGIGICRVRVTQQQIDDGS